MKMAFSGLSLMRLRMTYTNWPTVRSDGTRYLRVCVESWAQVWIGPPPQQQQKGERGLATSSCINKLVSCSNMLGNSLLLVNVGDVALLSLLHNDLERHSTKRWQPPTSALALLALFGPFQCKEIGLTGILSGYLSRMRAASAWRFSAGQMESISRGHNADQCQDAPRAGGRVTSQPRLLLSSTDRGITQRMLVFESTRFGGHPIQRGYYEARKRVENSWNYWFAGDVRLLVGQEGAKGPRVKACRRRSTRTRGPPRVTRRDAWNAQTRPGSLPVPIFFAIQNRARVSQSDSSGEVHGCILL